MKGRTFRGMDEPEKLPTGQFLLIAPNILVQQLSDEAVISLTVNAWTVLILPTSQKQQSEIWALFNMHSKQDKSVLLIVAYSVSVCLIANQMWNS